MLLLVTPKSDEIDLMSPAFSKEETEGLLSQEACARQATGQWWSWNSHLEAHLLKTRLSVIGRLYHQKTLPWYVQFCIHLHPGQWTQAAALRPSCCLRIPEESRWGSALGTYQERVTTVMQSVSSPSWQHESLSMQLSLDLWHGP